MDLLSNLILVIISQCIHISSLCTLNRYTFLFVSYTSIKLEEKEIIVILFETVRKTLFETISRGKRDKIQLQIQEI
jgi:hypothetical protein